jgi:sorbose reductase
LTVTDAEAVKMAVDQVVADFGKLDCFVANAGMAVSKPILEISLGKCSARPQLRAR